MEVEKRLSVEDLMKQRYKVIADYPDSIFKVGGVLVEGEKDLTEAAKYPHLFRKLQWWQDRQESELPKYVKAINSCCIITKHLEKNEVCKVSDLPDKAFEFFLPATESEYLTLNK